MLRVRWRRYRGRAAPYRVVERHEVKICGLTRAADARAAERAGADYLGFVLTSGFGRSLAEEAIDEVVQGLSTRRVAVLVDESLPDAIRLGERLAASVLQLHGRENPAEVAALADSGPWDLWKAVRVREEVDVDAAVERYGRWVQGFLIEGWRQGVAGGGGVRLTAKPDRVRGPIPASSRLVLAGGLDPSNVGEAIHRFRPDVVDVSSGIETEPGRKNHDRIVGFIEAARAAFRDLEGSP